ncbi:MAG: adenylate/guanylate cyclase domain-containing protein [Deltaproteobacteria bacterium]|nr:adenylate/guanylate cyclase domain-containing protein [Deltaproteobacteria bacterium]
MSDAHDSDRSGFSRVASEIRLGNARRYLLLRGIAAATTLAACGIYGVHGTRADLRAAFPYAVAYLIASLALLFVAMANPIVLRKSWLGGPVLDLPFIFQIMLAAIPLAPSPAGMATLGCALLMLLVGISVLTMRTGSVVATVLFCAGASAMLLLFGEVEWGGVAAVMGAYAVLGFVCLSIVTFTRELVAGVARQKVLEQARRMLRETFGRYVSEEVAQAVLDNPDGTKLGGESRDVTILFSDLRGYSTICESLQPDRVVGLLNEYFGAMSEIINAEGGCVIEFLGDAILAVFGAPNSLPDHAARAVRVAARMRVRTEELNKHWDATGESAQWKSHGIPQLASRIGLHSGRVVAGNLGSHTRVKYAVVGDAVNTASRVENLNNALGTDVLLTAAVMAGLPQELASGCEDRGEHKLKGKEEVVRVFGLAAPAVRASA